MSLFGSALELAYRLIVLALTLIVSLVTALVRYRASSKQAPTPIQPSPVAPIKTVQAATSRPTPSKPRQMSDILTKPDRKIYLTYRSDEFRLHSGTEIIDDMIAQMALIHAEQKGPLFHSPISPDDSQPSPGDFKVAIADDEFSSPQRSPLPPADGNVYYTNGRDIRPLPSGDL